MKAFNLKKYLPFVLVVVGLLVFASFYFLFIQGKSEVADGEDTSALINVELVDRPYTTLTPSSDGHWLKLNISKIKIPAYSLDYELLYHLPDGAPQGVPGTIMLNGQETIERDLLLGSESSGRFRYDEGVENGTLTLRFRNDKGKLLAKFVSDFHLQNSVAQLTSVDGNFSYTLGRVPQRTFFVTMPTFGVPGELPEGSISSEPYGVLSSSSSTQPGTVGINGNVHRWTGNMWENLTQGASSDLGLFISTSE